MKELLITVLTLAGLCVGYFGYDAIMEQLPEDMRANVVSAEK